MPYPNINAERSRAGMTVEDLAKSLGVTRKTVYNWMAHGISHSLNLKKCQSFFIVPLTICWKEGEADEN